MDIFASFICLLGIVGFGSPIARRINEPDWMQFLIAFLVGSYGFGLCAFGLSHLGYFNLAGLSMVLTLGLLGAVINHHFIVRQLKSIYHFGIIIVRQYPVWVTLSIGFLIGVLLLLCGTPPRSGDAMRYHLAQLKDMVQSERWVFRPYYCYHFPQFFTLIFAPAYVLGGGVGMKASALITAAIGVFVTWRLGMALGIKAIWPGIFLLCCTPLAFQESTIVVNDWAVIVFGYSGFLLAIRGRDNWVYAGLAMGLSLGCKYQAILLVPCFLWFFLKTFRMNQKDVFALAGCLLVMAIVSAPFYIRNYIYHQNPVWPLFTSVFNDASIYLNVMAQKYSSNMTGSWSVSGIITNAKNGIFNPQIPILVWVMAIVGALLWVQKRSTNLLVVLGIFFLTWLLIQPRLYWRFSIFILPFACLAVAGLLELLKERKSILVSRIAWSSWGLTIGYGLIIFAWYSSGLLSWYAPHQKNEYHQATWYYDEYQWINRNTEPNARFLVLVGSGHTYYLDRDYLRADPDLSGEMSWNKVNTAEMFLVQMKKRHIDYILISRTQGTAYNQKKISEMLEELISHGQAILIWQRDKVPLCAQRMKGAYIYDQVALLKLKPDS